MFAAVRTLYIVEAIAFTSCGNQVATDEQTAVIDGTTFTASPVTFTFKGPLTPLFLTHDYPDVTLTSLTVGDEITLVCSWYELT